MRVVDENIRAGREFPQTLVEFGVARFIVRGIHHGAGGSLKPETQAALGMVQPAGRDARARHLEMIAAADFRKFALGAHGVQVDWKIRIGHLRFKDTLQAARSQVLGPETVKMKAILFRIQRRKKRNALDVVPVVVRHENVRLVLFRLLCGFQVASQHAQSGTAIEDHAGARRRGQLDAGGIPAVAPGGLIHGGRRAAHTPETKRRRPLRSDLS